MQRFRRMRCLHKFAALHSSVCNRFNTDRRLSSRPVYKANRAAALVEQRALCAG